MESRISNPEYLTGAKITLATKAEKIEVVTLQNDFVTCVRPSSLQLY